MNHYRFWLSYSGFNLNTASFLFVGSVFQTDPDYVIVIATKENDNCTFDKIEQQDKIFIKDISRENMGQNVKFKFHLIYSSNGKLLKQTLNYFEKSELSFPEEINL